MADKVQKIKDFLVGMAGAACCDAKTKKNIETIILPFIDSLQEEPVSEGLEEELDKYIKYYFTIDTEQLDRFGIEEKDYMFSIDKSDILALVEHFTNWQKTKDESTTEDLGEYINELSKQFPELSFAKLSRIAVRVSRWQQNQDVKNKLPKVTDRTELDEYAYQCAYDMSNDWAIENPTWKDVENACKLGANWQQEKEYTCYEEAFEDGAKWKVENLWKPADGDDLPEIDREVVALLDNGKVVFAHRPPEYWDGKDIVTGKVTRNYPKTYGKGGWNIPDVKWWLDCLMPKEIEL